MGWVGINLLSVILWDSNKPATVLAGGWMEKEAVKSCLIQFSLFTQAVKTLSNTSTRDIEYYIKNKERKRGNEKREKMKQSFTLQKMYI